MEAPMDAVPRDAASPRRQGPVGVFDSGVGGLSVWREIVAQLPGESSVYVGDQVHIPYGPKPAETLFRYAEGIVHFLLAQECKAVVVACNSASAAALKHLRQRFPAVPFIGMEPAVKPAAQRTKSGVVVVLATPATLQGELFTATTERHAGGIEVVGEPCPGLVSQIEAGRAHEPETEAMLRAFLGPGLSAGADQVVLACTHYPFVIETIRRIAGPSVDVIDPAPAVARQLRRLLADRDLAAPLPPALPPVHRFFTTGADVAGFAHALRDLVRAPPVALPLQWIEDSRLAAPNS
jgi:glutamate racemase